MEKPHLRQIASSQDGNNKSHLQLKWCYYFDFFGKSSL